MVQKLKLCDPGGQLRPTDTSTVPDAQRKLAIIKRQHGEGTISQEDYEKQVADLWDEYKDRL